MKIHFTKMHGLGNDFIIIDDRASEIHLSVEDVQRLCDRHTGIGADGIMLVRPAMSPSADYAWWFANADGTIPEMCGNGIRCFVRYLVDNNLLQDGQTEVVVDTARGPLSTQVLYQGTQFDGVKVNMGLAELLPAAIPTKLNATTVVTIANNQYDAVVGAPLEVPSSLGIGTDQVAVTAVSMGNPHAVIIADDYGWSIDDSPVHTLGAYIETHTAFPAKTNVEFVKVHSRNHVSMRVWERGCGETQACGTGACATVVACYLKGLTDSHVKVSLLGGDLDIQVNLNTLEVLMTGPATVSFNGQIVIND